MRAVLTGDVMLGRLVAEALEEMAPAEVWGNTLPVLREADLLIMNLECVITTTGAPWEPWHKVFHFRAGPAGIEALLAAGVDCVTLANNHVLDFGQEGLWECLNRLEEAGIAFTGAGRDEDEAARPAFLEAGGLTVAVVAFTDNMKAWAAGADRPGVNYAVIDPAHASFARVTQTLAAARRHADLVLASFHWGPNMVRHPPPLFHEYARRVIEAGADVFYGHSSHLFQGVAVHRGRLILHDCGDLVDDYAVDPEERNDLQFLYVLEVGDRRTSRLEMRPVKLEVARVDWAGDEEADWLLARMSALCEGMGTPVRQERGALVVTPGRPVTPTAP